MCKSLKDYSEYTERVRKYARDVPVEEAVERAIQECIEEDILAEFLKQNRAEAKSVSIYEYDQEKHMRQERETFWEEGREDHLKEQIQKKLARGKSISVIAEEVEEEKSVIEQIIRKMEENKYQIIEEETFLYLLRDRGMSLLKHSTLHTYVSDRRSHLPDKYQKVHCAWSRTHQERRGFP